MLSIHPKLTSVDPTESSVDDFRLGGGAFSGVHSPTGETFRQTAQIRRASVCVTLVALPHAGQGYIV